MLAAVRTIQRYKENNDQMKETDRVLYVGREEWEIDIHIAQDCNQSPPLFPHHEDSTHTIHVSTVECPCALSDAARSRGIYAGLNKI